VANAWHARPASSALEAIGARDAGLSQAETERRLREHGANTVSPPAPTPAWRILAGQLRSVIVYLPAAAIAISLIFGDRVEATAIAAVLLINTLPGFVTELRARRAMEALISLDVPRAIVLRDGALRGVDASGVVPGDVIELEPALALAMEPADADVMARPPRRPDEALLSAAFLSRILFYAVLITASTLGAFVWALSAAPDHAVTMAFMTLAFAQTAHLGNARSEAGVLRPAQALANPYAVGAVVLTVTLQILAISFAALAALLRLSPLSGGEWLVCIGLAAAPAAVGQAVAVVRGRR
jgi:magnesium-transporting ATPase (P-type)